MTDHYKIDGPAIISFSGGRTSAFMLAHIIEAHGGQLPDDVVVCFANTGKEHPTTLEFVRDCQTYYGIKVYWLEYRYEPAKTDEDEGKHTYAHVNFDTASRNGEPFSQLNRARKWLPNPVARTCTANLKVRVLRDFATQELGWDHWQNVIGLRADEPRRVAKATAPNKERWEVITPMARAGHTLADVTAFWSAQSFDLKLPGNWNGWGNCDGCFLKARHKIERIAIESPQSLEWWANEEETSGQTFRVDRPSYRQILTQVSVQGRFQFADTTEDDTIPCNCTD